VIDTSTKIYGVIGDPIEHSLSPLLQNWLLDHFQQNARYFAFHVCREKLKTAIDGARALGVAGLNVTLPHKEAVVSLADWASNEVSLLHAANTLKIQEDSISAFVTDPPGFIESLGDNRERFADAHVVLFGAGGSARSIAFALSVLKIRKLTIINRTLDRADALTRIAVDKFHIPVVSALRNNSESIQDEISDASILINATSAGMHSYIDASPLNDFSAIGKEHFVYDLIYNPAKTLFLRQAERRGAVIQNGLDMLIFQGLESLRIWREENFELNPASLTKLRRLLNKALGS